MAMEKHFIQEGVIRSQIESYLRNELNRVGYSGINITKTPLSTRVTLYVEKPPLVIGRKGRRINELTQALKDKYGVDSPEIDVQRIEIPTLDPNIVSRRIAVALERGMNRRRVAYKALRAVMSSGARGVEIKLSGKLVGKGGRSRTEKYLQGYMKKAGDSLKLVSIGSTQAYLKAGVIGITVRIVPPDVLFPDQIRLVSEQAAKALDEIAQADEKEGEDGKAKETESEKESSETTDEKTPPKPKKKTTKKKAEASTKTKKESKTEEKEEKTSKTKTKTKKETTKKSTKKTTTTKTKSKSS